MTAPDLKDRGPGTFDPGPDRSHGFETPTERLQRAYAEAGYASAEAFAAAVGVKAGTLRQQLARGSLSRDAAVRYAAFLRCSVSWLLTGRQARNDVPEAPAPRSSVDRDALRIAISATEILGRHVPLTEDQRADMIADLIPVLKDRLHKP
jgi:hypothetical protein